MKIAIPVLPETDYTNYSEAIRLLEQNHLMAPFRAHNSRAHARGSTCRAEEISIRPDTGSG